MQPSPRLPLLLDAYFHLVQVLHRAFCGFNHDPFGWFAIHFNVFIFLQKLRIYFNGAKRCTDVGLEIAIRLVSNGVV